MKLLKIISILALALASGLAFAAAPGKIAVSEISGKVAFVAADGSKKQAVVGDVFGENTRVATDAESSAKIVLANGTIVALKPGTEIEIAQFEQNNPDAVEGQDFASFASEPEGTSGSLTTVRLVQGTATFKVAKLLPSSKLTVKTRGGNITVKGTTFSVSDNGSQVSVVVVDGAVSVAPTGRATVSLSSGKAVSIPVSPAGTVGSPVYKGVSASQEKEIQSDVASDAPAAEKGGDAPAPGDAPSVGVDPEVPSYAEGSTVDGPNAGRLNSASSL